MAADWRNYVLREFAAGAVRLTVVADPDGLLLEPGVAACLHERGFAVIPFEDAVAFRFAYESQYRARWDRGEATDLVVALRSPRADLRDLPYDLRRAGRALRFTIGDLFPQLSYPVAAALDRADFDRLHRAYEQYEPRSRRSDHETADFLLQHVFQVMPSLVQSPADLLRVLIRKHRSPRDWPEVLSTRFAEQLRREGRFEDWPLDSWLTDKNAFYAALQRQWDEQARQALGLPAEADAATPAPAPTLPFDHDDIKPLMADLFAEGVLRRLSLPDGVAPPDDWRRIGLATPTDDPLALARQHLDRIGGQLPAGTAADHRDWLAFARRYAELLALRYGVHASALQPLKADFDTLRDRVDAAFSRWLAARFGTLYNLPPSPPAMVHHLPRYLREVWKRQPDARLALLLIDGLALDQWLTLRDGLREKLPALRCEESAVFAWIPTLTSISRQAAFAGEIPLYFGDSLTSTAHDGKRWRAFWEKAGLPPDAVGHFHMSNTAEREAGREALDDPRLKILGLTFGAVDDIMHGNILGETGMHRQVAHWCEQGEVADWLIRLRDGGFRTFLATDHGNIAAAGMGASADGVLAEQKSGRARLYATPEARAAASSALPGAVAWDGVGLLQDQRALLAPGRMAFGPMGRERVTHGGFALEEVIVPWIELLP